MLVTLVALVAAGCSPRGPAEHAIEKVRLVDAAAVAIRWDASSAERFGLALPGAVPGTGGARGDAPFRWDTPAGWTELPPTPMRAIHLAAGAGVTCYVTVFPGDGGGELANVNRWRGQLGLPAVEAAELEQLERIEILGEERPWIDLPGDEDPGGDGAMLAVVCPLEDRTVFVKMVGPRASVEAERERFRAFCASLRSPASR